MLLEVLVIEPADITKEIVKSLPDARVRVEDLTGGRDHYRIEVTSTYFAGKTPLARHRMVVAALRPAFDERALHALSIATKLPSLGTEETNES